MQAVQISKCLVFLGQITECRQLLTSSMVLLKKPFKANKGVLKVSSSSSLRSLRRQFTSLLISTSALGSVCDSLGMGLVGKEYFRSWDSSQPRFWTPAKPTQPSLSVGSASTTVAAAMFVAQRRSAACLRPAHNEAAKSPSCLPSCTLQRRGFGGGTTIQLSVIRSDLKDVGNVRGSHSNYSPLAGAYSLCVDSQSTHTAQTKTVRKEFTPPMGRLQDSDTCRSGRLNTSDVFLFCLKHQRAIVHQYFLLFSSVYFVIIAFSSYPTFLTTLKVIMLHFVSHKLFTYLKY